MTKENNNNKQQTTTTTRRTNRKNKQQKFNQSIHSSLLKAGYIPIYVEALSFSDSQSISAGLINRIQRGDFNNAKYVLSGHVIDVGVTEVKEIIQGTSDFSFKSEYNLLANFIIVDSESLQTVADFNVEGKSNYIYIGGFNSQFTYNSTELINELIKDFNNDALKKIIDYLPPLNKEGFIEKVFSDKLDVGDGDPATLRIYKLNREKSQTITNDDSGNVIIYKK
jgi:hypothetical protein